MKSNDQREFTDFVAPAKHQMPKALEESILSLVQGKLRPQMSIIFSKVIFAQMIAGIVILSFCPQLGVGFTQSSWLMDFFMQWGHVACTYLCGALFLTSGAALGLVILSFEERRAYLIHAIKLQPLLALISVSILYFFGATESNFFMYGLWMLGGIVTSFSLLHLTKKVLRPRYLAL